MTSADLLPAAVLKRKAVVYVRQSTQAQVQGNLESQRRQYGLVDIARQRGFRDIEGIDDDLGRSASGMVSRPGFERLVAWLCAGEVGAVLCFDASRLARNGRDWHHLLELCGLVDLPQLLVGRGFRRSCLDEPTIVQEERDEKPVDTGAAICSAAPAQHAVRFRKASGDQPLGPTDGAHPSDPPSVGGHWRRDGGA